MGTATSFERGFVLFQLGRYSQSEKEFFDALQDSPDNALAYSMIAMCKINQDKRNEPLEFAKKALELDPDLSYGHYVLAYCYARSFQSWLAMPAITEAIRLDPDASQYWGFKAYLHLCSASKLFPNRAREALECSEKGLECDPTNAQCMQLRVRALLLLNRKPEAFLALNEALALDPLDSESHEMRASFAFEGGQSAEARAFYEEALRLDPNSASARSGLMSALRAKHAIYRFLLKFMTGDGTVKFLPLILIGGAPFAVAYLYRIPNPVCQAISMALILPVFGCTLFALFAFFLANPIFNLILWIDPETRWSLSSDEILAAKLLATNLILVTLVAALASFHSILWYLPLALVGLLLAPTVIIFAFPPGKFRKVLYVYLAVDFLCVVLSSVMLVNLDFLDANFKPQMEKVIGAWASLMSVSVGLSIFSFGFEAFADRLQVLISKYRQLRS